MGKGCLGDLFPMRFLCNVWYVRYCIYFMDVMDDRVDKRLWLGGTSHRCGPETTQLGKVAGRTSTPGRPRPEVKLSIRADQFHMELR